MLKNKQNICLFITVGSTEFDALLNEIFMPQVVQEIALQQFTKVTIQKGRGKFELSQSVIDNLPFKVEIFDCKPSLENNFKEADFVISHCGAGTLLEGLKLKKKMCAVVNDSLMNNHQEELLNKLLKEKYIFGVKKVCDLGQKLKEIREAKEKLKEYPELKTYKLAEVIESLYL